MDVTIVAPPPARESLLAAFEDTEATATTADAVAPAAFGVVGGEPGADRFAEADEAFDRWVAVEIGGLGGRSASMTHVTAFGPSSGCYDCLRCRVAAADGVDRPDAADATSDAESAGGVADDANVTEATEAASDAVSGSNENGETGDPASDDPWDASAMRFAGALAGHRAVRFRRGAPLAGTTAAVDGPVRRFTRTPGCGCHDAPSGFARGTDDPSLAAAVERMERAVDERVGLVVDVGERESFPLPYYVARTADTSVFSDVRCGRFGGGAAVDWNEAYAKSVGEALERYCAGTYRRSDLRRAPTAGVVGAVPVDRFVRPDDAPGVAPDERLAWVDGVALASGEYAALPAAFTVFPPPRELAPPITTGLGAGTSTDQALRSGLLEVIERDATMLAWYSTFEPMGLTVETDRFDALRKRARAEGLSVTPLLCTADVDVPVVACAVHRDGEWPRFAAGSAAGLDARRAAADALAEALQNWTELRGMGPERAAREGGAIGRYADFPAAARAFVDTDTRLSAAAVGVDTAADRAVDALIERVTAAGLEPYAARLTTSDAAELGFEVVRVVVPGAQPLFTGEPFFGDRLHDVPPELGFEPRPDRPYHPYP